MYIEAYWGDLIGGSDDSLTLTAYLAEKRMKQITLEEIFSDFGAETLFGDYRNTVPPLCYVNPEGWEMGLGCAIDLIADLAALLLESEKSGYIDLLELDDTLDIEPSDARLQIISTPREAQQMNTILADFAAAPEQFDISEFSSYRSSFRLSEQHFAILCFRQSFQGFCDILLLVLGCL